VLESAFLHKPTLIVDTGIGKRIVAGGQQVLAGRLGSQQFELKYNIFFL
jgi:hypothetical protein